MIMKQMKRWGIFSPSRFFYDPGKTSSPTQDRVGAVVGFSVNKSSYSHTVIPSFRPLMYLMSLQTLNRAYAIEEILIP